MATNPGTELATLDFGNLIGGPLVAVITAQSVAARSTADFIKTVGFYPKDQKDAAGHDISGTPIYVDFKLPQQQLALIADGQAVNLTTDSYPGVKFVGKINAIDPRVDASTRNFQAEATVPNPDRKLLPGMFTRVGVVAGEAKHYLTLPQTAITYNPYGATVFLAQKKPGGSDKDLIAQQSFVTLGPTRGDQVAVLKGIKEGDQVVTSGQMKLVNGAPLIVDNSVLPANDPSPSPQEQ